MATKSIQDYYGYFASDIVNYIDCKEYFKKSLFVVGIGVNDYNYPLVANNNSCAVQKKLETLVPLVTERIAKAIVELIKEAGAVNFLVPGVMVSSCKWESDIIPAFIRHNNEALQQTLENVRNAHPHVNITYADYYGAAMVFYRDPKHYGFTHGIKEPCCQGDCGSPGSTACRNPSEFVCWDGAHLTEAAYKIIANGLMHANFTSSSLNNTGPFL